MFLGVSKILKRVRRKVLRPVDDLGQQLQKRAADDYHRSTRRNQLRTLFTFAALLGYLVLGGLAYSALEAEEGWEFFDGVYFSVTTISTVGFGDLNPSSWQSRLFTVIYGTVGIAVAFAQLTRIIARVQKHAVVRVQLFGSSLGATLGTAVQSTETHLDDCAMATCGRITGMFQDSMPVLCFYVRGLWLWVACLAGFQLASAAVFVSVSPDSAIDYGTACWHTWVVASTVGYGLVASSVPTESPSVAIWATIHIILSISLFTSMAGRAASLVGTRAAQVKKRAILEGTLNEELLDNLDRDGNGVDRMEFVVGMLAQVGVLKWGDVEPFLEQFDAFDLDKSGHLDSKDIAAMAKASREAKVLKQQQISRDVHIASSLTRRWRPAGAAVGTHDSIMDSIR